MSSMQSDGCFGGERMTKKKYYLHCVGNEPICGFYVEVPFPFAIAEGECPRCKVYSSFEEGKNDEE